MAGAEKQCSDPWQLRGFVRDMTHDDIVGILPVLDCKVLDINMVWAKSGDLYIDDIDS